MERTTNAGPGAEEALAELENLFTGILGFAELIQMDSAETEACAREILTAATRAHELSRALGERLRELEESGPPG